MSDETPDDVASNELLNRAFFDPRDWQDGEIHHKHFNRRFVSVFRDTYYSVSRLVEEKGQIVVLQLLASDVDSLALDVAKFEDEKNPRGHAHIQRRDGMTISRPVAIKLRDAALKRQAHLPPGVERLKAPGDAP